jgi:hypothetical protein
MEVMKEYGLVRGENELELYLMAEFLQYFDGRGVCSAY